MMADILFLPRGPATDGPPSTSRITISKVMAYVADAPGGLAVRYFVETDLVGLEAVTETYEEAMAKAREFAEYDAQWGDRAVIIDTVEA